MVASRFPDAERLVSSIKVALVKVADPEKAAPMQAYMKSSMPYRGVPAPVRRKACEPIFREIVLESKEAWKSAMLDLWRNAEFREERYEAIDLAGVKAYRDFQTPDDLPMYEEMIVEGAWWDYVDEIAVRRVGHLLSRYPAEMKPIMRTWSTSDDIWKRRTSIISQLKFKSDTDLDLLYTCMEPSMEEKEFFLRKAIGWALREYAKTDPDEVKRFVALNEARLSGLSKREALRRLRD